VRFMVSVARQTARPSTKSPCTSLDSSVVRLATLPAMCWRHIALTTALTSKLFSSVPLLVCRVVAYYGLCGHSPFTVVCTGALGFLATSPTFCAKVSYVVVDVLCDVKPTPVSHQIVELAKSGRFRFVVKLHGRCQRVLHPDVITSAGDQYLNPLTPVEVDSIELLAGVENINIVDGRFHNLLPFLDAFDTVSACTAYLMLCLAGRLVTHELVRVCRLFVTWTPVLRLKRRISLTRS
jgi:hypothetical protein